MLTAPLAASGDVLNVGRLLGGVQVVHHTVGPKAALILMLWKSWLEVKGMWGIAPPSQPIIDLFAHIGP